MRQYLVAIFCILISLPVWAVNDPMRPPFFDGSQSTTKNVSKAKPLTLSMILNAGDRKAAVINGKSVQVGETISGYRVLRIDAERVVVSRKGKVKEVYLGKPQQRNKTKVANRKSATEE